MTSVISQSLNNVKNSRLTEQLLILTIVLLRPEGLITWIYLQKCMSSLISEKSH